LDTNKSDLMGCIEFEKRDIQRSEGVREVLRLYDNV